MLSEDTAVEDSEAYEEAHVHQVYEQIAPHFSQTRYKPWPLISDFLRSLPAGSIGIDVGSGNGKYLTLNPEIYIIGSDRSRELVAIANTERCQKQSSSDAIVGDILSLPHRNAEFDFAVSIAVVHHLSTRDRRVEALKSILMTLKSRERAAEAGKALIYVWALEQKTSRRGWDEGHEQDVMVPWVMRKKAAAGSEAVEQTFKRYYHLYREGELEAELGQAGGIVVDHGYEKDNWWAIAIRSDLG